MTNPLQLIREDQQKAKTLGDPNSDLCVLALSDFNVPSVRTLVLRDVSTDGLTLFVNKSSPKWTAIESNNKAEILIWYSTTQTQYRINGTIEELPSSFIEHNWERRPIDSKYLDYAYQSLGGQSSEIDSREQLSEHIIELKATHPKNTLTKPKAATSIMLRPKVIEKLDLNASNRLHDRQRFSRVNDQWHARPLIP
jgi:pyridoxine/pyridoxamine 5'-phosphate oxidase